MPDEAPVIHTVLPAKLGLQVRYLISFIIQYSKSGATKTQVTIMQLYLESYNGI